MLCASPVGAQTSASLQGGVFDPSGAVVPRASVRIQHHATGTERAALTDPRGRYEIVALTVGEYRLEVQAAGFRAQIVEALVVNAARTIVHDVHLTLGDVSETVAVDTQVPLLDRAGMTVGHVFSEQFVQAMPLNGRRFVDLGFQLPGSVTPVQGGFLTAPSRGDGFYGFNTAGNREDAVNVLVNGVSVNDQFTDLTLQTSMTNVEELKIDNSTFSAAYGRNSGSIVHIVTRSGTNAFGGEVFTFLRNERFDARNFFNRSNEPELFRRQQFGATLGGPLVRNRVFFHTTYEGQRQRQGLNVNSLVLSDAERSAVGDPRVAELLQFIPRANVTDSRGVARFVGSTEAVFEADQGSADLTVAPNGNSRTHIYYWHSRDQRSEPLLQGNTIPGFGDIRRRRRHTFTLNEMTVVGTTLVNEARLGFLRALGEGSPAQLVNPSEFGIQVGVAEPIGLPQISVAGGLNFGGPANFLTSRVGTTFVVSDTASYQRSRHSLRFGGEYRWYINESFTKDQGRLNFPAVSDFISGMANAFSVTLGDRRAHITQNGLGLFVQDQLAIGSGLTIELGLRYDETITPEERDDRFVVFDRASASLLRVGTQVDRIYESSRDLQPRLGVAWNPLGDRRTVVRAAYGAYVNQPIANMLVGATTNPPLVTPLAYSGVIGLDNAITLARAAGLAPSTVDPEFEAAMTQSWNVNVQRELLPSFALMAGYFGARGSHLRVARNVNQPIDGQRPFPALAETSPILPGTSLGNIMQIESSGRSSYQALWLSSRGQVSRALQLTASYTLARSTDYNSLNTQGVVAQNSYDLPAELGPSDFDARHRAVVTAIYQLPFRGSSLAEGWQLAAIVQAQSGSPVNIVTSNSTLNGTANTVRPDVTGSVRTIGDVERWFDTTVFVPAGRFGNLKRNAALGPRFDNTDLSISKTTNMGHARLELRVEIFNVFNHPNVGQPGNVVGSPNFSVITNTRFPTGEMGSSRQIQIAVKLSV